MCISQVLDERLEDSLAILLVVSNMRKKEWNTRVLAVMLAISRVILVRKGEEGCFRREDGVENDHSPDDAVQAAGSRGGNPIPVHSMQDRR